MGQIFNIVLHQPMFNALVFLYKYVAFEDLGVAIILLTILIRLILYPLFYHSFKNQTLMQKIQPDIKKIQHDHKDDKEKQAQALLELYKTHKVNPFSGFLLILVQLPVLIVLYQIFLKGLSPETFVNLYHFIAAPTVIHNVSLGLIDLQGRSILIVVLAAVLQYAQAKLSLPKKKEGAEESPAEKMSRNMAFIGPILTIVILSRLPAAVGLYWLTSSAFSIFQQVLVNKSLKKNERGIQNQNKDDSGNAGVKRT